MLLTVPAFSGIMEGNKDYVFRASKAEKLTMKKLGANGNSAFS